MGGAAFSHPLYCAEIKSIEWRDELRPFHPQEAYFILIDRGFSRTSSHFTSRDDRDFVYYVWIARWMVYCGCMKLAPFACVCLLGFSLGYGLSRGLNIA